MSYPQGAAGKLLCTALMRSVTLSHWDSQVEHNKDDDTCLEYVRSHFTNDLQNWLNNEPDHSQAWGLSKFISSKYPRGDDLTEQQFKQACYEHATAHFHNSIAQDKLCLYVWNKSYDIDIFDQCKKVTVLIDEPAESWFDYALWHKHYAVEGDRVKFLVHDTASNKSNIKNVKKFNNPIYSEKSVTDTYAEHITDNPDKKLFNNQSQFANRKNNICVNLSDLLDQNKFVGTVNNIVEYHAIAPINSSYVKSVHQHWLQCHVQEKL